MFAACCGATPLTRNLVKPGLAFRLGGDDAIWQASVGPTGTRFVCEAPYHRLGANIDAAKDIEELGAAQLALEVVLVGLHHGYGTLRVEVEPFANPETGNTGIDLQLVVR